MTSTLNVYEQGKYKESYEAYNKCNKMDDYSVPAMVGSLMCHCVAIDKRMRDNKKISDVGDQLEFLTAIKESSKISAVSFMLAACLLAACCLLLAALFKSAKQSFVTDCQS